MSDDIPHLEPILRPSRLKRWLREPLLHFLAAGLALFAIYAAVRSPSPTDHLRRIELTTDDLRRLEVAWTARWQRRPTQEELRGLIEDEVRQEIFYREALALGLDRGDTIVKRRLAQKMEFLAEDVAALRDPPASELKAWFEKHSDGFVSPPRITFRHLYFSFDVRHDQAGQDARRALASHAGRTGESLNRPSIGDPFMFQDYYADRTAQQVIQVFGTAFTEALFQLRPGAWLGPIESGYGWHLVWIDSLTPGRTPSFEEVEPAVRSEWLAEQRAEARRKSYEALKARYEILLQGPEGSVAEAKGAAFMKEATR